MAQHSSFTLAAVLSALRAIWPSIQQLCAHIKRLHAACRYDWFGDHNLPWQTDLNSVSSAIDWNKINAISASPNTFDKRDPAQTGGGFGLLPWYLRSAAIPPRPPAPAGQPVPAPAGQATGG